MSKYLKPGTIIKTIGSNWNPSWRGILKVINECSIEMIDPENKDSTISKGVQGYCSRLLTDFKGTEYIIKEDVRKNHLPEWL